METYIFMILLTFGLFVGNSTQHLPDTIQQETDFLSSFVKEDDPSVGISLPQPKESNSSFQILDDEIDLAEELRYFIELGEREIELTEHKDVVLLVGLTGTGKTTLLQFVGNDSNRLYSEDKCSIPCEEYRIRDEGGYVNNQSLVSQTFLPNFLYNSVMDTAFYDCPGFDDNRNRTVSIANAYFIKKITSHANSVKILVIATHTTMDSNDRSTFGNLLENLLTLLHTGGKFNGSLAIVGTGSISTSGSPTSFINKYARFWTDIVPEFIEDSQLPPELKESAYTIREMILQKDSEGNYTNIGYFKTPDSPGPLANLPDFIENKLFLRDLITKNLGFANTTSEDFGVLIGSEAQNVIVELVSKINLEIREDIVEFSDATELDLYRNLRRYMDNPTVENNAVLLQLKHLKLASYPISAGGTGQFSSAYLNEITANCLSFGGTHGQQLNLKLSKYANILDTLKMVDESSSNQLRPYEWIAPLISLSQTMENYVKNSVENIEFKIHITAEEAPLTIRQKFETSFLTFLSANPDSTLTIKISDLKLEA